MLTLILALVSICRSGTGSPDIRSFLQVTPEFCTGGQPRIEHFAKLKADGGNGPESSPADRASGRGGKAGGRGSGLKYFNIPVNYQNPSDADVDQFLKITDDPANRPMFIHCTAAIRVGAFWMIRRVLRRYDHRHRARGSEEGGVPRSAAPRTVRAGLPPVTQEVGMCPLPRPNGRPSGVPARSAVVASYQHGS